MVRMSGSSRGWELMDADEYGGDAAATNDLIGVLAIASNTAIKRRLG